MSGHMDKDQIEEFLKSQVVGRLGCTDGDKVYVVPITFAYDNGCIYGHTKDGLKIRMMRKNPNVCFETDWVEDLSNWKSVIAYGTYEELDKNECSKAILFSSPKPSFVWLLLDIVFFPKLNITLFIKISNPLFASLLSSSS